MSAIFPAAWKKEGHGGVRVSLSTAQGLERKWRQRGGTNTVWGGALARLWWRTVLPKHAIRRQNESCHDVQGRGAGSGTLSRESLTPSLRVGMLDHIGKAWPALTSLCYRDSYRKAAMFLRWVRPRGVWDLVSVSVQGLNGSWRRPSFCGPRDQKVLGTCTRCEAPSLWGTDTTHELPEV